MWDGYSLLYLEGNEKSHHQDLGKKIQSEDKHPSQTPQGALDLVWQSSTQCRSFSVTSTTCATMRAETTSLTGCPPTNQFR